jgi:hypothetical protein
MNTATPHWLCASKAEARIQGELQQLILAVSRMPESGEHPYTSIWPYDDIDRLAALRTNFAVLYFTT